MNQIFYLRKFLLGLPRSYKRAILIAGDFFILLTIVWVAMAIRYGENDMPEGWLVAILILLAPTITVATFACSGLYRLVTRFITIRSSLRIATLITLSVLIWSLIVLMTGQQGIPRSVILSYGLLAAISLPLTRQAIGALLTAFDFRAPKLVSDARQKTILIYGAGEIGLQVIHSLRGNSEYEPVGFIDADPSMWGQYLGGLKVYRPDKIGHIIERSGVSEVLLAMSHTNRRERRQLLSELSSYPVSVRVLPAMKDIATGQVSVTDTRPLRVEDLLGRDPVPPNLELLSRSISGKSILVTGAGGSIGSEIVRQTLKYGPSKIVLFDLSESALYDIEMSIAEAGSKLLSEGNTASEIFYVLGSVLDEDVVAQTITEHGIETIFHAAAYKHVPIIEENAVIGLQNNTFGCEKIARIARRLEVERFVLVSTDKAVRPTNVMGASKRIAEMILQAHASEPDSPTVFTMVRFGNVLDSSGSVVQRFRNQISKGGPLTVTHPKITRYFMSIPEAAGLVIQAGAMATGGEVFVLEMGDPVKIDDLARLMIKISGLEMRSTDMPDGDLEILYTGLRPGEKLYEELLIGTNTLATEHPRIFRSNEPFIPSQELHRELAALSAAMRDFDINGINTVLGRIVEGYHSPSTEVPENHKKSTPLH